MGVNGEAPACQPPTRSPSPHRVRMAVAEVQMRAAGGPCARRGMLDAGARSRHDVVGTHRSKERLSAAAQRCRAGLVVVSLKDVSHGSGKKFGSRSRGRVLSSVEASAPHRRLLHTEDPSVPELLALPCSPPRRAKAVGGRPRHALTRASRAGHGVYAVDVPAVVTSRNLVTGPLDLHSHRSPRLLSMQAS